MGVQWTVALIVLWVCGGVLGAKRDYAAGATEQQLCDISGCNCTSTAGSWKTINCTLNSSQKLTIGPGWIPPTAIEVSIIGGDEITISSQTFYQLRGFNLLRVDSTRSLTIRKHAFDRLDATSLELQVLGCNSFILENHAFKSMQTPIRADIQRCQYVSIQNSAFSRLQEAKFQYIHYLELAEGAFTFENQGDIGRHGPVTNLSFHNVTIPKIPRATFTSSLAEINIRNSEIRDIHSDAFKASQISAVFINTTTIHRVQASAFSQQTLIYYFMLHKCRIILIDSHAILSPITNLTVEFSFITEIKSGAINSTVTANILISDNKIKTLATNSLIFNNWNKVIMEHNVIVNLHENFLVVPYNPDILEFSFSSNEISNIDSGAFNYIPELQNRLVHFKFNSNYFKQTCRCEISEWFALLLNSSHVQYAVSSSFCQVNTLLSNCFQIGEGLINMKNFSELVCGPDDSIKCEPYNGETKILDTTSTLLLDQEENDSHVVLVITLVALLVLAVVGTAVILLVRGGLWLKKKGYCARFQYNPNAPSNEDEGAMVEEAPSEKFEAPDELTHEILQELRDQLENPDTHNQAREMIERLYELFIVVDDGYTNNNRQDEEAHLYEELGNMQSGNYENKGDGIASYLKLMEDKLNIPLIDQDEYKPPLVNEYSEPTDAAIHLYSELKNKIEEENEKKGSVKSHSSTGSKMAFRPLPEKPKDEAGPSSKY